MKKQSDTQRIQTMSVDELRATVAELSRMHQEQQIAVRSYNKVGNWIKTLVVGAFTIGIWVASHELRQQDLAHKSVEQQVKLHEIEMWKVETNSNRFTSKDASEMMNSLMSAAAAQDKRLQRVEDSNIVIKESLQRIEAKIQ